VGAEIFFELRLRGDCNWGKFPPATLYEADSPSAGLPVEYNSIVNPAGSSRGRE